MPDQIGIDLGIYPASRGHPRYCGEASFDVVQEPHLELGLSGLNRITLETGRRGDVILKGGRLWRSTEVTLGSQKADEIVVLPNMEGIIATFRCVRPQIPRIVDLRVWTSEGVTGPGLSAELSDPQDAAERTGTASEGRKGRQKSCAGEGADIVGRAREAVSVAND